LNEIADKIRASFLLVNFVYDTLNGWCLFNNPFGGIDG
jgi:hypothetical protein